MNAVGRTVRQAWHESLYGAHGFYALHRPTDHFATSLRGIPGGVEVMAQAVRALAREHGCDTVLDVGCGRGELLTELAATPGLRLVGVDVVDRPAGLPESVDWVRSPGGADLPDLAPYAGRRTLVWAHEWLDVVPCTLAIRDDAGWREAVLVGDTFAPGAALEDDDAAWLERYGPADARPVGDGDDAAPTVVEVGRARDAAWSVLLRATRPGVAVAVDYGYRAAECPGLTLTGFRGGRQGPAAWDGSTDITAHVAIDSLIHDTAVRQTDALARWCPDPGPPPHALASQDPPAYLRHLRARAARTALCAPGGLGDFWWIIASAPTMPGPEDEATARSG